MRVSSAVVAMLPTTYAFIPFTHLPTSRKIVPNNMDDANLKAKNLGASQEAANSDVDIQVNDKKDSKNEGEKSAKHSPMSLGSYLLERKHIEEDEIEKLEANSNLNSTKDDDSLTIAPPPSNLNDISKQAIAKVNESKTQKSMNLTENQVVASNFSDFDEAIQRIANDAEEKLASIMGTVEGKGKSNASSKEEENKKEKLQKEMKLQKKKRSNADPELIREVDESVTIINTSERPGIWVEELMKDIQLVNDDVASEFQDADDAESIDPGVPPSLPLSDPQHLGRIDLDMRRLATAIASTIETEEQWKTFCEDGGGILPLLECIRDGAREIRQGLVMDDLYDESVVGVVTEKPNAFEHACRASKALRDLCAISKSMSAIITDGILRANASWSKTEHLKRGFISKEEHSGLIVDLVSLLRYASDADKLYQHTPDSMIPFLAAQQRRAKARRRCGLYITQLLLAMSLASDEAVKQFRITDGLVETILSCSSYAKKERIRRRWVRYPIELAKRLITKEKAEEPFLAAASIGDGLTGSIQGASNQLLAAIGYNQWYPKRVGQRGLRILCLDGGGTRGITAISTMRSIVDALGGVEVCDAFDIIAGTSTGAIIAFLVGLRRESSLMARKRYDQLIKRIFVKSALSTPMLLFTTATYDEAPFNSVMMKILRDNSMLSSRADPRVPLVFAISSKMSVTPTQLCLFRNYNYSGGEMEDSFVENPLNAKAEIGLAPEDDVYHATGKLIFSVSDQRDKSMSKHSKGSRHPGSFRVLQRAALRATTAAPTVFKPVLMGGELYCDGGIVASNPSAVAIHEARTIFPDIPIEMVVSCGTGAFVEEKSEPRIGWDGIIGQIVNSATDGEQTHHVLEDILGQGGTAKLGRSHISKTKYYRFNPIVGTSDTFPIDGTDPLQLRS